MPFLRKLKEAAKPQWIRDREDAAELAEQPDIKDSSFGVKADNKIQYYLDLAKEPRDDVPQAIHHLLPSEMGQYEYFRAAHESYIQSRSWVLEHKDKRHTQDEIDYLCGIVRNQTIPIVDGLARRFQAGEIDGYGKEIVKIEEIEPHILNSDAQDIGEERENVDESGSPSNYPANVDTVRQRWDLQAGYSKTQLDDRHWFYLGRARDEHVPRVNAEYELLEPYAVDD